MQQVALSWLVYRMTNSALLLGFVGFVSQIPAFIFSPFAGVIADRHNRRRLLIITQALAMIQASILSLLVITNRIEVWHIIVLSSFLSIINSFDIPIRQAFTVEMIEDREDLGNAIALNSSMFNVARLLGPSIAGILIALAGEGICFVLNAVSYLAVIISLCTMGLSSRTMRPRSVNVLRELKEGFVYAFGFSPIKNIIIFVGLISLVGVPYQILMPIFAKDIFHGGARTLGFLVAMSGLGAFAGAMYLAARKSVLGLAKIIPLSASLFGIGIIAFSLSGVLWVSMAMVLVAGFGMMVQMAASNIVLQTIVDEDKRGRIMSFYAMAFMGAAPFGSLCAGSFANKIGAPHTLLIGGGCCILGSFLFARELPSLREKLRPIYVKKGVIPQADREIQPVMGMEIFLKE